VIHLIHGVHNSGTACPIEGLVPYLTGYDVKYPDYGWIAGVETRLVNPIIVGSLKPYINDGDILIGHSNGCAIAYELMRMGANVSAVFINAALEQDIVRFKWVPWIDVYFNSGDEATELAKIAEEIGIVDLHWGEMGHSGYAGTDPKITNIDCGRTLPLPVVSGHSDFFTPEHLAVWGPYLANRLRTNK
jgi:hypothetical protein